jgi:hypothetical protein
MRRSLSSHRVCKYHPMGASCMLRRTALPSLSPGLLHNCWYQLFTGQENWYSRLTLSSFDHGRRNNICRMLSSRARYTSQPISTYPTQCSCISIFLLGVLKRTELLNGWFSPLLMPLRRSTEGYLILYQEIKANQVPSWEFCCQRKSERSTDWRSMDVHGPFRWAVCISLNFSYLWGIVWHRILD